MLPFGFGLRQRRDAADLWVAGFVQPSFDGEITGGKIEHTVSADARRIAVAKAQGLDEFAVYGDCFVAAVGGDVGGVQRIFEAGVHGTGEAPEHLVVAGAEQQLVERHVGFGKAFRIIAAVAHALPGVFQIGNLASRGAFGCIFCRGGLYGAACLEDGAENIEIGDIGTHPFQHVLVENVPVIPVADSGADARLAAHEALGFQHLEGFADNSAADAVHFAKIVFARQGRAG